MKSWKRFQTAVTSPKKKNHAKSDVSHHCMALTSIMSALANRRRVCADDKELKRAMKEKNIDVSDIEYGQKLLERMLRIMTTPDAPDDPPNHKSYVYGTQREQVARLASSNSPPAVPQPPSKPRNAMNPRRRR